MHLLAHTKHKFGPTLCTSCLQKVEGMQQSLHYIGLPPQNKHKVFVESSKQAREFDPAQYFDTPKVKFCS